MSSTFHPMIVQHHQFQFRTNGKNTYLLTEQVARFVQSSQVREGIVTVFVPHTSCSLVLMENADPTARADLHEYFERLVPENSPYFRHTDEGPDDMPSHIRMALTRSSETIPIRQAELQLGIWQGIYLFEHRRAPHHRDIFLTVLGIA